MIVGVVEEDTVEIHLMEIVVEVEEDMMVVEGAMMIMMIVEEDPLQDIAVMTMIVVKAHLQDTMIAGMMTMIAVEAHLQDLIIVVMIEAMMIAVVIEAAIDQQQQHKTILKNKMHHSTPNTYPLNSHYYSHKRFILSCLHYPFQTGPPTRPAEL